jgi:hypothetical protein
LKVAIRNKAKHENSFNIFHWKEVVSCKANYSEIFQSTYSLKDYPEEGDKSKEKTLSWFNRLSDIRNKTKHKVGKRVTENEYLEIKNMWGRLKEKIQNSNDDII